MLIAKRSMVVLVVLGALGYSVATGSASIDEILEQLPFDVPTSVTEGVDQVQEGAESGAAAGSGPETAQGAPPAPSAEASKGYLKGLKVEPAGTMSDYDREAFAHWSTAQDFGWKVEDVSCDTRNASLLRDAAPGTKPKVGDYCDVESGKWLDPYTGNTYTDPGDMDIDHVVALGNAWRSGADGWTDEQREFYANDPVVLLTAEDNANQEKGDKGPEAWVPPNSNYLCEYSRRWIGVKTKYDLSINPQEKAKLQELLATC